MAYEMTKGGMSGFFTYQGPAPGPLPSWRAGTPPGPLGLGETANDLGVSLTFGKGRSPKNMVPIPRRSGTTYEAFKDLQRNLNRMLEYLKTTPRRIDEDGIIGAGTVKAVTKVEEHMGQSLGAAEGSANVARRAVTISNKVGGEADRLGVPQNANKAAPRRSPTSTETTAAPLTPSAVAALTQKPGWTKYAKYGVVGLGALALILLATTRAKKKRSRKGGS